MPRSRTRTRALAPALGALVLAVSLVPGLVTGSAQAGVDGTCVGKGEYQKIHGGITIQKLVTILDGQTPLADRPLKGAKRIRWYAACEEWQPDKDVAVRYHEPVVGRRTVTKRSLGVYVSARAAG